MFRVVLVVGLVCLELSCAVAQQPPERPAPEQTALDPSEVLRTFQTYCVKSSTVYMKSDTMQETLQRRPEFAAWGLQALGNPAAADVAIEINLPFLTWEWNYTMVHSATGAILAAGKVKAMIDRTAASSLAAQIVDRIKAVRALPAVPEANAGQPEVVTYPSKSWPVKYAAGAAKFSPGTPITLTVSREQILGEDGRGGRFLIPSAGVVAVAYNNAVKDPASPWYEFWESALANDTEGAEVMVAIPVVLAGAGLLELGKATQHFVRIDWQEHSELRGVVLNVAKSDCDSLLKELETVTHKERTDLPNLGKNLRYKLEHKVADEWEVELDRGVWVGWLELPRGKYEVVLLKEHRDRGEVYFVTHYEGWTGERDQIVGQALVQVERRPSESLRWDPLVIYKEENGISSIGEIRTSDLILRFNAVPLTESQ